MLTTDGPLKYWRNQVIVSRHVKWNCLTEKCLLRKHQWDTAVNPAAIIITWVTSEKGWPSARSKCCSLGRTISNGEGKSLHLHWTFSPRWDTKPVLASTTDYEGHHHHWYLLYPAATPSPWEGHPFCTQHKTSGRGVSVGGKIVLTVSIQESKVVILPR